MTGQFGGRRRPWLQAWACPLCEREVTSVSMWLDHRERGGDSAIYFHGDNDRCFVANQRFVAVVSQIGEIGFPRENTQGDDDDPQTQGAADDSAADGGHGSGLDGWTGTG